MTKNTPKTSQKPIESAEAEQTVIGSLLLDPKKISEILEKIRPDDFYYENHRLIFQAMTDLDEANQPIDYKSVFIKLQEENLLDRIGGLPFLMKITEEVGFSANVGHFVEIVRDKSTLRRLSVLAQKTYHACFNGHKPGDLIIQTQEQLAALALGASAKRGTGWSLRVKDWIKLAPGQFEIRQLYTDLGVTTANDKKAVLMALMRIEKEGLVEKLIGRRGQYRIIEAVADRIDFLHADSSNWLNISLPLEIDKYARIFPTNIIVVAGEKGSGKTAFCLDTARMNMNQYLIRYLSSEMAAEELRERLDKFGLPIEEWNKVDFRSRRENFADLIDPDAINIIDFLEIYDQFWKIAQPITEIFAKLKKGICIIAIQKDKGTESGRGGMFTREKCRLHVALSKKNEAKIDDVKVFAMPGYNPNGLVLKYKLVQGARFKLEGAEADGGDGKYGRENW